MCCGISDRLHFTYHKRHNIIKRNRTRTKATAVAVKMWHPPMWGNLLLSIMAVASFAPLQESSAFVTPARMLLPSWGVSGTETSSSLFLAAGGGKKRKRRRRKKDDSKEQEGQESSASVQPSSALFDDSDLPEFDLKEDSYVNNEVVSSSKSPKAALGSAPMASLGEIPIGDTIDPALKEAMRGSGGDDVNFSATSPKDLIRSRDRSLEKQMEFDEIASPLPRPGVAGSSASFAGAGDAAPGGKKRAKAEARKAAALKAKDEENVEEGVLGGVLSSLPISKEGEDVTPMKLVELATWVGIFLLVGWELYLNSPFFDRAAPLAPVVYEFLI